MSNEIEFVMMRNGDEKYDTKTAASGLDMVENAGFSIGLSASVYAVRFMMSFYETLIEDGKVPDDSDDNYRDGNRLIVKVLKKAGFTNKEIRLIEKSVKEELVKEEAKEMEALVDEVISEILTSLFFSRITKMGREEGESHGD